MRTIRLCLAAVLAAVAISAAAVEPNEMLSDPALEARARELSKELRCLVCQNQSIDDSNAALARDLRILVRQRLKAGDSDEQVIDFVTARYGDFVLLRPPFKPVTLALWLTPPAVIILGALAVVVYFRRRRGATAAQPLSPDEQRRIEKLLDDMPGG